MSSPVLRQKSFIWPDPDNGLASLQYVDPVGVAAGTALLSSATTTSALLVLPPSWDSDELSQVFPLDEQFFPGLQSALGVEEGTAVNLQTTALVADHADGDGVLAVLALADLGATARSASLLVSLSELATFPSRGLTTLVPSQQVNQLLLPEPNQSDVNLISIGSVLPPELTSNDSDLIVDRGSVTTVYELQQQSSGSLSRQQRYSVFPATADDITSKGFDGVLLPAEGGTEQVLVQVGTVSEPTITGLSPSGSGDILISAIDSADGSILWEELFGNSSVEQTPRIALADDNALYVGATLQGSFGDGNPAADSGDVGIGIAKYTSDGDLLWRRRLADGFGTADGGGNQVISDLTVATDGSLLVLGLTTTEFGGLHGQAVQGDGSDFDSFITAYSPEGNRLWTHQFGSPDHDFARSFAFMPVAEGDASVDSLVVVGDRAPVSTPDQSQAWMQVLELSSSDSIASQWLAPAPPVITWAVVEDPLGDAPQLRASGTADPGALITLQSPLFDGELEVQVDVLTGEWLLDQALEPLADASQPSSLLTAEAQSSSGLVSDAVIGQAFLGGSGLPGEAPQILWIDPDGSGPQSDAPLLRSITRLGSGPNSSAGQRLLVDYSGTLTDGTPFDSSLNEGRRPFELTLGAGRVIKGWDLGLQGLPLGSQVELIIPPSLAYGERERPSIPANSTLLFDVDLRADLRLPEAFLRDVVWPDLFNADYSQLNAELLSSYQADLLQLAAQLGPADGTSADDSIAVVAPVDYPQYPLLALGADGADQLSSDDHAAILFGEWGDDALGLTSSSIPYGFLDGGDGNDLLWSSALFSWFRGGSGLDRAVVPPGDWRLLQTGNFENIPWFYLARYADASATAVQQILYLQSIETFEGFDSVRFDTTGDDVDGLAGLIEILPFSLRLNLSSPILVADLIELGSDSQISAVVQNQDMESLMGLLAIEGQHLLEISISDEAVVSSDIVSLLEKTSGSIDVSNVVSFEGRLDDVEQLLDSNQLTGFDPQFLYLSDTALDADDLLRLAAAVDATIDAQALLEINGSTINRNAVFNSGSIQTNIEDDEAAALVAVYAPVDTYAPDSTIPITLEFDEPVQLQFASTEGPSLQLSHAFPNAYVQDASAAFSLTHRFDALVGSLDDSNSLQVIGIDRLTGVIDQVGNQSSELLTSSRAVDGVALERTSWSLDVDGDGQVTALGDGLMIIRELFGSFQGPALTDKVISSHASRSSLEIKTYIQQGLEDGFLDVDRNGSTDPLSDGLMILRELFGSTFHGAALIDQAISSDSPFLGGVSLDSLSQAAILDVSALVSQQIRSLDPYS